MKISPIINCKINFGQRNDDGSTRNCLRRHIESSFDASYNYSDELGTISRSVYESMVKGSSRPKSDPGCLQTFNPEQIYKVDTGLIASRGVKNFCTRENNKLYSGEYLILNEKIPLIKVLKQAGINSVLALVNMKDYEDNCKDAGLNYIGLNQIGGGKLYPHIIKYEMLDNLINDPSLWAQGQEDAVTKDLKEFIKIMNGENEKYPYPIYYGCTQGSNITTFWTEIYRALKDEDPQKPLSEKTIDALIEIDNNIKDCFRA